MLSSTDWGYLKRISPLIARKRQGVVRVHSACKSIALYTLNWKWETSESRGECDCRMRVRDKD